MNYFTFLVVKQIMKNLLPSFLKEIRSWLLPIGLFAILYFTGTLPEVMGFAQRLVLKTGLLTAAEMESREAIPAEAWSFPLVDFAGNPVILEEFKGKVIFINAWATWCPPCVAEMPSIQSLYTQVGSDKVQFVMLSLDKSPVKARKFMEQKGYTFPSYFPQSHLPRFFHTQSIPTTWIIGADGTLVSKKLGMAQYDTPAMIQLMENEIGKVGK
jgi:thiol-disulfide isomerase/thioredoxin